jgi:pyruvate,orthophosphate dikinase
MSYGLDRNDFDKIMVDYKFKYGVMKKIEFPPKIMREIAFAYKQLLLDNGIEFEQDPYKQIKKAIVSVFNSWDTPRAKVYRKHLKIADEWGTAVIVQQMVFGNLHRESGSGVLFTNDLQENALGINISGDFSFLSQGEDIVAGLINTLPISEHQRLKYYNQAPFSLESAFPKIFERLKEISRELVEIHGFSHQEIEFTFEKATPEDLYLLQTRNMSIPRQTHLEVFDVPESSMARVGCGIGIGNTVMNGVVVFDLEDIEYLKKNHPEANAILVRPDTVPDDIEMIFNSEGLLTSKGGAASHAAVTAASLGKTCVVNCNEMLVFESEKRCVMSGVEFHSFDQIAIDGTNGLIFKGNYPIRIQEL